MELDLEAKEQFQQRFTIISLLGKGSFGYVYQCQDKNDNQIYAVKVISKNNVKRSKIDCLREQAKMLSTIDHPNIVKVYEFVQTNTFIFLKMEIVKNGTLQKLIKRRWQNGQRFTDDEIALIMNSLFKGVSHIHSASIIHRDIKPENILLPNQNRLSDLKIADFGLSTKLDFHYPKTATSKCGTMLFMAPQILCNYTYTKSVDVWACAIIMYILYSGKHPFYESKMTTDDYKRKIKSVKFPPLLNKLAQDFIGRISKIEPNERYTTQQALKHPWLTRNFDDQIPLSLHQSYSGFEKTHEISHVLKTFLVIKNICRPNIQNKVPQNYIVKKEFFNKEGYSIQLNKSKSKQSARDIHSFNELKIGIDNDKSVKDRSHKKSAEIENDNPTIMKLNSIFNSLFGKKTRLQMKTYTQGATHAPPKQNRSQIPDISEFKERIQTQIERAVIQFKTNTRPTKKRILPCKPSLQLNDPYVNTKDDLKNDLKLGAYNPKQKFRKKNPLGLKMYD